MTISIKITMKESARYDTVKQLIDGQISEEEARKMMKLKSVRQVRRIKKRVKKEGLVGIAHRSRGKPSNRKLNAQFIQKIMSMVKSKYHDFKPGFAAEKLWENHQMRISSESLRQLMIKEDLWTPKARRNPGKRHVWRDRKDNFGEMQQFDGSYHDWLENGMEACLLASIDDATGKITHAKFDKNEGVVAVFKFWLEYFERHGLPVSIYLDKFSTYKINHPSAVDNKDLKTQFERAMGQVGVKPITAHSAEAKGRVERLFGTLQDRLVKELRLNNIKTIEAANQFLEEYIPKFNAKFAVIPKKRSDLHRATGKEINEKLPQIFSIQSTRKVMNDYTIMFKNRFLQLAEKQPTGVFKKDTVIIEEHLNDDIKVRLKDHYLNYDFLPARPKKMDIPVVALTKNKAPWTPPANHPWRGGLILTNNKSLTT